MPRSSNKRAASSSSRPQSSASSSEPTADILKAQIARLEQQVASAPAGSITTAEAQSTCAMFKDLSPPAVRHSPFTLPSILFCLLYGLY
jgi:hypothetical protein